jgi:hypothetical protein
MDGDHMVVDEVENLVWVVCGKRTDAVPKGSEQCVFEIDPRIQSDFGFDLGGNYRLLLGIDH